MSIINELQSIPATNWYHLAAFILTGAGAQYSVQLIKVIGKNKYGKGLLRFLNGLFSTLYVAAGAFLAGGASIGKIATTSAAIATVSVLIYRVHNNFLYKAVQEDIDQVLKEPAAAAAQQTPGPVLVTAATFDQN